MERMEFINKDWEEKIETGTTLSILPVFGGAEGIVTKGLKYAFNNQNLIPGKPPSGVSNLVVSNPVSVNIKKGKPLLVVQHKDLWS